MVINQAIEPGIKDIPEVVTCKICGVDFDAPRFERSNGTVLFRRSMCDPCDDEDFKKRELVRMDSEIQCRQREWLSICPSQYRFNDVNLIDRMAYGRVLAWIPGPKGLDIVGDSRKGKTTTVWRLLEKLYVERAMKFEALTESEFHQTANSKTAGGRKEWLDTLIKTPILFLDDVGHSPAYTKDLEQVLYVVEGRTSWRKPIITTRQFTSVEMESRAGFSGGTKTINAIMNRIRASSHTIEF